MKKEKDIRLVLSVIVSLYILSLSGCWSSPPKPPSIPPVINAKLPAYGYGDRLNWSVSDDYDALGLFYIDYSVEYAKQNTWYSICEWYIYKLNKIEMIEGEIDEDEIYFLNFDAYAKPYGIQFTPMPTQYEKQMVLQLGLKKQKDHYAIVSEQLRSWIAPYGEINEPNEEIENFDQIINSVISYFKLGDCRFNKYQQKWRRYNPGAAPDDHVSFKDIILSSAIILRNADSVNMGRITIVEETEKYYVVEAYTKKYKGHLKVDKTTFEVNRLPVPEKY